MNSSIMPIILEVLYILNFIGHTSDTFLGIFAKLKCSIYVLQQSISETGKFGILSLYISCLSKYVYWLYCISFLRAYQNWRNSILSLASYSSD